MSKIYKIYTAGKMTGLPYEEQMVWRKELERVIKNKTHAEIVFVHPPEFYTCGAKLYKTTHEIRAWDLSQIRSCDVAVFDISTISSSVGALMELATVDAINHFGYKTIYAIGVGKLDTDHPWITDCLLRCEDTVDAAAEYIAKFLLI